MHRSYGSDGGCVGGCGSDGEVSGGVCYRGEGVLYPGEIDAVGDKSWSTGLPP